MAEYWFDGTDGSNSNDGLSVGAPKRSIASGLTVSGTCIFNIKRGTTVTVDAVTYPTGAFILRPYGSGSARAKVYCANQLTNTGSGGSYTVNSGVHMIGPEDGATGAVVCADGAIYVNDVYMEGFWNAVAGGSGGGYVRNSRIWTVGNNGVNVGDTSYAAPNGFEVTGNYIDATGALNDAITYHDGTGTGVGGLVANNTIIGANENSVDILSQFTGVRVIGNRCIGAGQTGIIVSGANCLIGWNYVEGSGYEGMSHHTGANGTRFVGNVVYDCGQAGTNANGFVARSTSLFYLDNNTIIAGPNSAVLQRLVSFPAAGVTGYARNNIFAMIGASVNRYVEIFDANASLFLFQNNCYFGANGSTNPFAINNGSSRTFAQWQALSALGGGVQDVGGMVSDPLLDASYRPMAGSPCLGAGTRVADVVLKDFYGKDITDTPDIGAVQVYAARSTASVRSIATARSAANDRYQPLRRAVI